MRSVDDTLADDDYDEFGLLHENAKEWDLPAPDQTTVERGEFELHSGGHLSFIRWGTEPAELVFLHGGGQNGHTWDTVALALGRPALAIDLPGHGRSSRREDRNYGPWQNAETLAPLLEQLAPEARATVGMSLGGATTIRLAATRPDLCRRAVIVDVTPQINDPTREMTTMERGSVALIAGPPTYDSFDEMAEMAIALSPYRAASGVRRGVRHNSHQLEDGTWTWRYDLFGPHPEGAENWSDFTQLWDDVAAITIPTLFVQGGLSKYVRDEDLAEMRSRLEGLRVVTVDGAGHAVQSDQPLELVRLIDEFVFA
jgi:pimeloyl-ACP methyl ester carboxylesterase